MSLMAWWAKLWGIPDYATLEEDWIAGWVASNRHRLRYCPMQCRWFWEEKK